MVVRHDRADRRALDAGDAAEVNNADTIMAPLLPAEISRRATPCLTRSIATLIEASRFARTACAGCSSIAIASPAWITSMPFGVGHSRSSSASTTSRRPTLPGGARADQAPIAWKPPSTWTISPVVAGKKSKQGHTAARSARGPSRPNRAARGRPHRPRAPRSPGSPWRPGVLSGPAATRLQRMPCGPRSRAR